MTDNRDVMEIFFCTGNVGKYEHLSLNTRHIKGINIIHLPDLDIVEPQADTLQEVALFKARWAYEKLKRPLIIQDSGIIIKELNDFPGPYTKYVSQTIGCKGILKLLKDTDDRSCGFDGCLVYIDEHGKSHIFNEPNETKYCGKIALPNGVEDMLKLVSGQEIGKHAANMSSNDPNKNLWTIFVPLDLPGNEKTLVQLTEQELLQYKESRKSCYELFAKWLENKSLKTGD